MTRSARPDEAHPKGDDAVKSHPSPRPAPSGAWPVLLALALAMTLAGKASAQDAKAAKPKEAVGEAPKAAKSPSAPPQVGLKEPVAYRVYQRDRDGRADIAVVALEDARVVSAQLTGGFDVTSGPRFNDGKLRGVPTGGPYTIVAEVRVGTSQHQITVSNVFVGDLWILAGQSNMEGVGDLVDVTPPHPLVNLLGMDGHWSQAREPLHWLVDSPDPVHSGNPADRAARSAEQHRTRTKGAGLGLPFAVAMAQATRVPVGLVATAHGGTSMAQWDPAKKGEGGNSLYGSFLRQVYLAGGKARGVLWYQGESDANPDAVKVYPKVFADFIAAVRADLGQPELPFYFVQIGRFIRAGDPAPWNAVQDAERRIAETVPSTGVAATVDLELDDLIHVGTHGLKRLGRRLALLAQRELFGMAGGSTPTIDRVNRGPGNTLVVRFKGVNSVSEAATPMQVAQPGGPANATSFAGSAIVGLRPARHIGGFSIRKADGSELPLIFDAAVGPARDTVILKLAGPVPEKVFLWYGHGFDPYANLTDGLDMAVPVFGPVSLDEVK